MAEKISEEELIILKNEIKMSERLSEDKLLPQMREAINRYTSRFVPVIANDWDIILNEVYPIIQYELPAIFFRTPRGFLKPRNKTFMARRRNPMTGQMEEVELDSTKSARTKEALLNYTLSEIRYKEEVRKSLLDSLLFKFGALWHGYKGSFGMTDEQSLYIQEEQIFVKRLSPMKLFFDPAVTLSNLEDARWIARGLDVPLQDIIEDDELDVDKKQLKGTPGYGQTLEQDLPKTPTSGGADTVRLGSRSRTLLDYTDEEYRRQNAAKFVKIYEIFKRPSKKEKKEGKKGKVILWTPEQSTPLRVSPWPYKFKEWPIEILVMNDVPDSLFGIADTEVWGEIADHKNLIINLQIRNAQENSKVMVGFDKAGLDEETIMKVQNGDQAVIGFDGDPRSKLVVASPGGQASGELYQLDGRIQNNLDDKSGVADIRRGVLRSGEESATSVKIRSAGAATRPAYRQDLMSDFLRRSFKKIVAMLEQFMPYDKAVRIIGSLDLEWSDEFTKEEIQAETDVDIDPISMLPENPEQEIQELQTILQLMQQALDDPDLSQKLQQEGKMFNLSPIVENLLLRLRIRDPEVFRNIRPEESQGYASVSELKAAQANTEAALQGGQPPSPPQPGQDHNTRLEVYQSMRNLFQMEGRVSDSLEQLILMQQAIQQQEEQKQARPGTRMPKLKRPSVQTIGALGG